MRLLAESLSSVELTRTFFVLQNDFGFEFPVTIPQIRISVIKDSIL
jgi:hypothetical protein